jgi:GntR family transcriptional regulator / MocR family aminotransferase
MPPGPCTHKTLKRSLGSMEPVGTSASFGPGRQSICAMRQVIDWCPPLATEIALTDLIAGGYLDRHLRRSRAVYRERYRLLWAALGRLLPVGYQLLPAQAGLHVAVVRPNLPADRQVWSLLASRGMQVGSLRRTYHFTDPAAGFLVGFGGIPTTSVLPACRIFAQSLEEVEEADGYSGVRPNGS